MNETEQQIWTMTQARKAPMYEGANLVRGGWDRVTQVLLDVAMTVFFWVDIGRVGGQPLDQDFRVRVQIGRHRLALMNGGPIPNQQEAIWKIAQQMPQGDEHIRPTHGVVELARKNLPGQRQAHPHRKCAPRMRPSAQDWTLAGGGPSTREQFVEGEAEFIIKHDGDAVPPRFFLSAANPVPAKPALRRPRVHWRAPRAIDGSSPVRAIDAGDSAHGR